LGGTGGGLGFEIGNLNKGEFLKIGMLETNSVALPIEDRLILGFGGTTGG
jgi:hypothetical protein